MPATSAVAICSPPLAANPRTKCRHRCSTKHRPARRHCLPPYCVFPSHELSDAGGGGPFMRLWALWLLLNRCLCCAAFGASLRVGLFVPGRRAGAVLFSPFSLRQRPAFGCQAHACSSRAWGDDGTMDSEVPLRVVGVFGCTGSGKSTVTQSSCALSIYARSPIARLRRAHPPPCLSAPLNPKPETRTPLFWTSSLFRTAIERTKLGVTCLRATNAGLRSAGCCGGG